MLYFTDALRAYDAFVIHAKLGSQVDPSKLNLPEEFKVKQDDLNIKASDCSSNVNRAAHGRATNQPEYKVVQWNLTMPEKRQRRNVVTGLCVKVHFNNDEWYGGFIVCVLHKGLQVKIKFDDGTSEISNFPDKDIVIVDELWTCAVSRKRQRKSITAGARVKARSDDGSSWLEGVIVDVIDKGRRVEIKFDDGRSRVSDFPDGGIMVVNGSDSDGKSGSACNDGTEEEEEDNSSKTDGSTTDPSDPATKKRRLTATGRRAKKHKQLPPTTEVDLSQGDSTDNGEVCSVQGDLGIGQGAKLRNKTCKHEGCIHIAKAAGQHCIRHSGHVKTCKREGYTKKVKQGGLCIGHGAKVSKIHACLHEGCSKWAQIGELCIGHGGKKLIRFCKHEGCSNQVYSDGVCNKHGPKRTPCAHKGCPKLASMGGICLTHEKTCKHQKCTKKGVHRRLCRRHIKDEV